MIQPKAALVDLYDTLLIRPNRPNPVKELIRALGFTGRRYTKAYHTLSTRPDVESVADMVNILAPQMMDQIDIPSHERLLEEAIADTRLVPEAKEVLGILQRRGVLLGAVSNTAAPLKRPFYDHGLDKYMTTAVFSCDVRYRKPHDMIYRIAFDKLQRAAAHSTIRERQRLSATAADDDQMVLTPEFPCLPSHYVRMPVATLRPEDVMVFGNSLEKDYTAPRRASLPAMVIDRSKGMDLYAMLDVFCNGNMKQDGIIPDYSQARISIRK